MGIPLRSASIPMKAVNQHMIEQMIDFRLLDGTLRKSLSPFRARRDFRSACLLVTLGVGQELASRRQQACCRHPDGFGLTTKRGQARVLMGEARPCFGGQLPLKTGAGEGIRTLDPNLGKVVLYP
jgi:hypothetical protein